MTRIGASAEGQRATGWAMFRAVLGASDVQRTEDLIVGLDEVVIGSICVSGGTLLPASDGLPSGARSSGATLTSMCLRRVSIPNASLSSGCSSCAVAYDASVLVAVVYDSSVLVDAAFGATFSFASFAASSAATYSAAIVCQ